MPLFRLCDNAAELKSGQAVIEAASEGRRTRQDACPAHLQEAAKGATVLRRATIQGERDASTPCSAAFQRT